MSLLLDNSLREHLKVGIDVKHVPPPQQVVSKISPSGAMESTRLMLSKSQAAPFHHDVLFIMVNQLPVKRTCNTMMAEKGCSLRVDAISFINLDQGQVHVSPCGHGLVIEMSICR